MDTERLMVLLSAIREIEMGLATSIAIAIVRCLHQRDICYV